MGSDCSAQRARRLPLVFLIALSACAESEAPVLDLVTSIPILPSKRDVPDIELMPEYQFECSGRPMSEAFAGEHLKWKGLPDSRWPSRAKLSFYEATGREQEWEPDRVYFQHDGDRGVHRLIPWQGGLDTVYFEGGGKQVAELHYLGEGERGAHRLDALQPLVDGIGVSMPRLVAGVCGDDLLIVYSTPSDANGSPSSLRQILGTLKDGVVEFSDPVTIFEGDRRVFDLEMVIGSERVDLLWQMGERLAHSSLFLPAMEWGRPTDISESSNSRSASLAARGDSIYVAWSDSRYGKSEGWASANGQKLMVSRSTNGGRQFEPAKVIGSVKDKDVKTDRTYLSLAAEHVVLLHRFGGIDVSWQRLVLEPVLEEFWVMPPVNREDVRLAYESWALPHLLPQD